MNESTTATETIDYAALLEPIAEAVDSAISKMVMDRELVTVEIAAREIAEGDAFSNGDVVEAKRHGNAKVIVKMVGLKTEKRFDPAEEVTVQRAVVTKESQDRRSALQDERRALYSIVSNAREPKEAIAKLEEYMAKGWYEQVAEYAAELAAGERVRGEWINAAAAVVKGKMTGVEALAKVTEVFTQACVNGYDGPTWSGGFTVKNAINQSIQEGRRKAAQNAGRGW